MNRFSRSAAWWRGAIGAMLSISLLASGLGTGAADAAIHRKMVLCEQMPHTLGIPLIRMIDGTGGGGSVKTLETIVATYIPAVPGWSEVIRNLETVPVVALSLGPTAGLGAARVVASHYSVMVKGLSQLFAAGPAVVDGLGESYKGSTDHQQAKESLGGVAHGVEIERFADPPHERFAERRAPA